MKYRSIYFVLFIFILVFVSCKKDVPVKPIMENLPKQLTQENMDNHAFLSPDEKHIAFYSYRYTYNPMVAAVIFELWIMDCDGFNQRRVIPANSIYPWTLVKFIHWENDSKNMIVQIEDGTHYSKSELWKIGVNGEKTKLYAPNLRLEQLAYSPDRTKISYMIQGPNPPEGSPIYKLYVANTDFTDSVRIEKGLINDYAWQSDSKGLIFSLYDRPNENFDLWKSKIDGTGKSRFSETSGSEVKTSSSSDGKYFAYSSEKSAFITSSEKFSPKLIMSNATDPNWIPNRNLLWVTNLITDGNSSFWGETWIIDQEGTIIKKIPQGTIWRSFSSTSKYFVYTLDGNIWIDYLD